MRVSELQVPTAIKCPQCGYEASAEPIQLQGKCSLICPSCGFHFYVTPKINGVAEVMEGQLIQVVGQSRLQARNTV